MKMWSYFDMEGKICGTLGQDLWNAGDKLFGRANFFPPRLLNSARMLSYLVGCFIYPLILQQEKWKPLYLYLVRYDEIIT